MLAIEVDTSLPALRVVRVLEKLRHERGLPVRIVIDHGTEFTSKTLDQWAYENKVTLHFITPGRPMENGYIESFHGKFREECLNEHWFLTLGRCPGNHRNLADRLQPGAPTQLVGLPDTGGIRNRLLRTEFAAKLKPECSHLPGLSEGGSSAGITAGGAISIGPFY
jgi:transposase InsO family protein